MAKMPEYPVNMDVTKKREPERRVYARRDSAGRPVADQLVTFTQVGWLLHTIPPEFVPLGRTVYQGVSFSPVWVEGPNE